MNICAVEASSAPEEIMRKFEESGFSRIPVYEGDIDTIIGIIHEKDFFRAFQADLEKNAEKSSLFIKSIMQKPFFAIETTKISLLLRKMQKERNHMAIVIDEYGGTSGLITMEDILEELVGEIYDEHDSDSDSGCIKPCGENAFIVSGETSVSKMMKYFELDEDETSGSTTVSGWITEKLGDFPEEGKKLRWQDKIEIEVLKTDKNTIRSLKVVKL